MNNRSVSVIVVSRERPDLLRRCLTGIGQLCHPRFEIVVVADRAGHEAVSAMGWATRVKLVPFDEANISAARNAGIAAAAGELVAFIDDDAVPEPSWLFHLLAPFERPDVLATGGYVLGRSGLRFQWRGHLATRTGGKIALAHEGTEPFTPRPGPGQAVLTEGTNSAFRRDRLAGIGGFDPAFRFYLDETDVNMRLADVPGHTVLVPLAQVHHGYAASARRSAERAPRDLREIGASSAVFLRKHAPETDRRPALEALIAARRKSLLTYMIAGKIEPRDVGRLLASLEAGIDEGRSRPIRPLRPIEAPGLSFLPFDGHRSGQSHHLAGRPWQRRKLTKRAARMVADGHIATVFCLGPSLRPHRVRFAEGGWWEQTGGLFGRADRGGPRVHLSGFSGRVRAEWAHVAKLRQCPHSRS